MTEFADEVRSAFAGHFERGGKLVASDTSEYFGDAFAEILVEKLRIRLVRERGQFFVDLANAKAEEWFDLNLLLRLVGSSEDQQLIASGRASLPQLARIVEKHLDTFRRVLDEPVYAATSEQLHELKRVRTREMFGYDPGH